MDIKLGYYLILNDVKQLLYRHQEPFIYINETDEDLDYGYYYYDDDNKIDWWWIRRKYFKKAIKKKMVLYISNTYGKLFLGLDNY